jgi:transcriptional regulator with XRE-family HTH domain
MTRRSPDAVDAIVGRNIRAHRIAQGMSQGALGKQIGVSFQQVQKCETGSNRIGSGRLVRIAEILDVPLLTLFDGVKTIGRSPAAPLPLITDPRSFRLLLAFEEIGDTRLRGTILGLVKELARRA